MKKIKNQIKFIAAMAVVGLGVSSCSLDMLPLNEVVLENYWTNKSDVESVVTSCYKGLQENSYVEKMIIWGEDRSDNITAGPDVYSSLKDLMRGSLKTTNSLCEWGAMYNVINRCNTVLYYAPQVAEEDPNYTQSDLNINIAECKALRAISFLTLIKTFKDVPFSLEPSIDSDMDYRLPRTSFEVILDSLIQDIESCKDYAPRKYSTAVYNTGKITRAGMYALLAELYLWRASDYQLSLAEQNEYYRKCIEACDWVINFKMEQYNANDFMNYQGNVVDLTKNVDTEVLSNYGYPLLSETNGTGGSSMGSGAPYAFNAIFGEGNSFESIFEVTYRYNGVYTINSDVAYQYGIQTSTGGTTRYVQANENLMSSAPTSSTYNDVSLFSTNTDFRSAAAFHYTEGGTGYDIYKYVVNGVSLKNTSTSQKFTFPEQENRLRESSLAYENWIIYRLTEIMLFRAEAEIELAGNLNKAAAEAEGDDDTADADNDDENAESGEGDADGGEGDAAAKPRKATAVNGASLSTAEELYDDAFNLISAIYLRSNPSAKSTATAKPVRTNYDSHEKFETLLMRERQRELLFEGKRYYDLVRQARREGNTSKFREAIISKYGEASKAVIIKMSMMDFMYMPIYKTQIQVNPNLTQNPAYADEEEVVIN